MLRHHLMKPASRKAPMAHISRITHHVKTLENEEVLRRRHLKSNHGSVGRLITSESHRARDRQHESTVGDTPGSLRRDPAGIIISRPLRVACGSGEPQFRQNEVEKLRAVERSKRATLSSPDNQRNACGKAYAFAAKALPVALRHREQWHFTNLLNGRSASNSTNPQRHPPRTDISHL
jgi:hypothetical protein